MRINSKIKICLISFFIICLPISVKANEDLIIPEYTEEYTEWLELSDEEKANCIEPQAYEIIQDDEIVDQEANNEIQGYSLEIDTNAVGATNLPKKYAREDYGKVKNQGRTDSCWAHSAATVFDTNYYITNAKKKEFSNFHMDYITSNTYNKNGFNRDYNSGGNMFIALAYATNGMGIALESNMPKSNINSATLSNVKKDAKVSQYLPLNGQAEVKEYIYKYGVVLAYTYIGNSSYFSSLSTDYNSDLAYCCTDKRDPNHAITLVGWNDEYTNNASKFSGKKGAYLALNSYGTSFGNNGLYYIFYDDVYVNETLYGVTKTTDIDYDYMYQYDTYGWTSMAGYTGGTYGANVFSRQNTKITEELYEISSYFPQKGNVTVYINANGNNLNIANATNQLTTYISRPGYYTLKLSTPVKLQSNQFSVCIKYPGCLYAEIPTKYGWALTATSNPGESYISSNGSKYNELQELYKNYGYQYANCCIKAFTKKVANSTPASTTQTNSSKKDTTKSELPQYTEGIPSDVESIVYNSQIYMSYNQDLARIFGNDAAKFKEHWLKYGMAEGRIASLAFDVNAYKEYNKDLYNAIGTSNQAFFDHFVKYGVNEARRASYVFDITAYKKYNQDLTRAIGNSNKAFYNHFVSYGAAEGRRGADDFDVTFYRYYYSDLTNKNNLELYKHYITSGRNQGRVGGMSLEVEAIVFDAELYKIFNQDLLAVFGNNDYKLKIHWLQYGMNEGRVSSVTYNTKDYKNYNMDLIGAIGNSNRAFFEHFVRYGVNEQRRASIVFDCKTYLAKNSGLKSAYGTNYKMYYLHFANYGINEGRQASNEFNITTYMNRNADLKNVYGTYRKSFGIHYTLYGRYEGRRAV